MTDRAQPPDEPSANAGAPAPGSRRRPRSGPRTGVALLRTSGPADIGLSPDEQPTGDSDAVEHLGPVAASHAAAPWARSRLAALLLPAHAGQASRERRGRRRWPRSDRRRTAPGSGAPASATRGSVLFAHNPADRPVTVRVPDIGAHALQLVDRSTTRSTTPDIDGPDPSGHGVRWIRLAESHCSVSRPASLRAREAHCVITGIERT